MRNIELQPVGTALLFRMPQVRYVFYMDRNSKRFDTFTTISCSWGSNLDTPSATAMAHPKNNHFQVSDLSSSGSITASLPSLFGSGLSCSLA
jgi:hypothetical protein